jgi:hypothetical protein
MNCLTGNDFEGNEIPIEIYGPDETTPHKRLEFLFRPCVPKQKTRFSDGVCEADLNDPNSMLKKLNESREYLGNPDLVILHNNERFRADIFGEGAIVRESVVFNQ